MAILVSLSAMVFAGYGPGSQLGEGEAITVLIESKAASKSRSKQ
jgi:hypothetical protein